MRMNAGIRKGRKRRDPLANILNTDQGIWSGKNIVGEMLRAVSVGDIGAFHSRGTSKKAAPKPCNVDYTVAFKVSHHPFSAVVRLRAPVSLALSVVLNLALVKIIFEGLCLSTCRYL